MQFKVYAWDPVLEAWNEVSGQIPHDAHMKYIQIFIQHDALIEYSILNNLKPRINIILKAGKLSSVRSEHAVAEVRLETVAAFCQFDGE